MTSEALASPAIVAAVRARLAPYARRVFLFGSAAVGEAGELSDLDILVELKPAGVRPPQGLRWFGIERELATRMGRSVDLVSADGLSPHLRPFVERQKVLLYAEG